MLCAKSMDELEAINEMEIAIVRNGRTEYNKLKIRDAILPISYKASQNLFRLDRLHNDATNAKTQPIQHNIV